MPYPSKGRAGAQRNPEKRAGEREREYGWEPILRHKCMNWVWHGKDCKNLRCDAEWTLGYPVAEEVFFEMSRRAGVGSP